MGKDSPHILGLLDVIRRDFMGSFLAESDDRLAHRGNLVHEFRKGKVEEAGQFQELIGTGELLLFEPLGDRLPCDVQFLGHTGLIEAKLLSP